MAFICQDKTSSSTLSTWKGFFIDIHFLPQEKTCTVTPQTQDKLTIF